LIEFFVNSNSDICIPVKEHNIFEFVNRYWTQISVRCVCRWKML